ncbi:MAG: hypothetical protein Q8N67_04335 [Candidatus Omnitrophota bacterium]|nr:hypothetical protein [Candidatus Omnitrophota bacterium]
MTQLGEGGDEWGWLGIRSSESCNKKCHGCKAVELHLKGKATFIVSGGAKANLVKLD